MGDGGILAIFRPSVFPADFYGKGGSVGSPCSRVPLVDGQLGAQRRASSGGPANSRRTDFNPDIVTRCGLGRVWRLNAGGCVSCRTRKRTNAGRKNVNKQREREKAGVHKR